MARTFKYREIQSILKRLGFRRIKGRGKGRHLFFIKEAICKNNQKHTIKTMVSDDGQDVHPDTLDRILKATGLTEELLEKILQRNFSKKDYEKRLLIIPKFELLPVFWQKKK